MAFSSFTPAPQRRALPPAFERYLATTVRPTARERQALMSGAPITKLLDSDASQEVAVFGAVWIDASPAQYVRRVKDFENFERGGAFRCEFYCPIPHEVPESGSRRSAEADRTASAASSAA